MNRTFGFVALIVTAAVYWMTAQPSVPFWDCSEFTAATVWQQVPHPPGAPLFLMIGKLFHLLIPFGEPAWKVNLVSVFSTAFTSFFLYHIIVMVIRNYRGKIEDMGTAIATFGAGLVGSLAFTFSDTVWFNGVESEVYAMATLFVCIVVYLMMRWNEEADNPGHERFLLLIAYVIGLSTGVHLLAVLTIFSIVYLVYFRKYKFEYKSFAIATIIGLMIFYVVYPTIVKSIPALLAGHTPGRNEAREYSIENSDALRYITMLVIAGVGFLFYYARKTKHDLVSLGAGMFLVLLLGYTTYTQILVRSNSNPPMNENEPKTFNKLAAYLGREQYGDEPSWPRRVKNEDMFIRNYTSKDENGEFVYGPWNPPGKKEVRRNDGNSINVNDWDNVEIGGELKYMFKYQMNHMFFRYLFWNYAGRSSDEQDAGWTIASKDEAKELNNGNGYAHLFPIRFFAIPLIFGFIGMFFHFYRDPKMAFVFMVMFLMMGVLAAIAQQQQDPQPRERDYFYTGAFLIWCLWIGLGTFSIIEQIDIKQIRTDIAAAVFGVAMLIVPVNMAIGGWKMHDRSGNFIPFDYSYNILQSTELDAILFTNGDNDTFPLWFLQDVMGVRRDIRIVNLSLGNTLWYVDQLKNKMPWGAKKVPLTFNDMSLRVDEETDTRALSYDFNPAQTLNIPIKKEILAKFTKDTSIINAGTFVSQFVGTSYGKQEGKEMFLYKVQDKVIKEILEQTRFERPIYFANTMSSDNYCGLDRFMRYEGMVLRVCPVQQRSKSGGEPINLDVMKKCLMDLDNTSNFSTTPKYGFKMRNLSNPAVYYDPVHRRLTNTYRMLFYTYATSLVLDNADTTGAIAALDQLERTVSTKQFPLGFDFAHRFAQLYNNLGQKEKAKEYAEQGIQSSLGIISTPKLEKEYFMGEATLRYRGPYSVATQLYEMKGDYAGARDILTKLKSKLKMVLSQVEGSPESEDTRRVFAAVVGNSFDILRLEIAEVKSKQGAKAALAKANELMAKLYTEKSAINSQVAQDLAKEISTLQIELGIKPEMQNVIGQAQPQAMPQ
ncbi:MAG: DUF2723 domain-containing protein [Candidatus Kapabacteria bacterium]|nr:DUF2723 domain-containing protein [Candidatus Kapabacteria bacterium]